MTAITVLSEELVANGFPPEWDSWVTHYSIRRNDPWSDPYMEHRPEPPEQTVEEWDEDCDGEAICIDRRRTPEEMRSAIEIYERDLALWIAGHGYAEKATVRYRLSADEWDALLTGDNGERAKLVSADGRRWLLKEWAGFEPPKEMLTP